MSGVGRLRPGLPGNGHRQPVHQRRRASGSDPRDAGPGHRPVRRHGYAGRALPRLAGGAAGSHGGDPHRVTLRPVDDRSGECLEILPERHPLGGSPARHQLPDRARPVRLHRRSQRLGQEHASVHAGGHRPADQGRDPGRRPEPGLHVGSRCRTSTAANRSASSSSRST